MLGASCDLEILEMGLIEHRHPAKTEETKVSASSDDAFSSGVLIESVRMESRPCSKSSTPWSNKE